MRCIKMDIIILSISVFTPKVDLIKKIIDDMDEFYITRDYLELT